MWTLHVHNNAWTKRYEKNGNKEYIRFRIYSLGFRVYKIRFVFIYYCICLLYFIPTMSYTQHICILFQLHLTHLCIKSLHHSTFYSLQNLFYSYLIVFHRLVGRLLLKSFWHQNELCMLSYGVWLVFFLISLPSKNFFFHVKFQCVWKVIIPFHAYCFFVSSMTKSLAHLEGYRQSFESRWMQSEIHT